MQIGLLDVLPERSMGLFLGALEIRVHTAHHIRPHRQNPNNDEHGNSRIFQHRLPKPVMGQGGKILFHDFIPFKTFENRRLNQDGLMM